MGFIEDIREEMAGLKPNQKVLRRFGLTLALGMIIIGALAWHKGASWWGWVVGAGIGLGLWGSVWPEGLKWAYKPWMGLALVMGWVVSRVILGVLFYLVLTPIGVLMRLSGRNPMAVEEREGSYWIERAQEPYEPQRSEKMY